MKSQAGELGNGNLKKLLLNFCIPALAGSLVTALYNIVDQLFIGNTLGIAGNAATNVVFPASVVITALSLMCGVGSSALMNLALGQGDREKAARAAGCGFALMLLCGAALSAVTLSFTRPLLWLFGCTPAILPCALPYARITALSYSCAMAGAAGPFIIRADGAPNYALLCTAVGTALNIILDALFIFGFKWGIEGAAWATVAAQTVSAAMVLSFIPRLTAIRLSPRCFCPAPKLVLKIAATGAGPACNFFTQAVVLVFLNGSLRKYGALSECGSEAVLAAAGVANKVNLFAAAAVTGLTNGMQPIVSYNLGCGNYARVKEAGGLVITVVLLFSFCLFCLYQLMPRQLTVLFGGGTEAYFDFAERYFRIFLMGICVNGLQSSVGGFFSAQGKPFCSIIISGTRQLLFLPALLVLLPYYWGLNGLLWAGPTADAAMAVLALYLLRKRFRELDSLDAKN